MTTLKTGSVLTTGTTLSYLNLPGSSGNYASSPDASALDIIGDLDARVWVTMADWTPGTSTTLFGKWSSPNLSYELSILTSGALQFGFSTSGSNVGTATSSATNGGAALATGITDGTIKWVRVTFDVDNGASGKSVAFYTSDDGVTWTQLGVTQTSATAVTTWSGTASLAIGATGNSGTANFGIGGHIHRLQLRNNILNDGTGIVFDADFSNVATGVTSFAESSTNAATVTINGTASIVGGNIEPGLKIIFNASHPAGQEALQTADYLNAPILGIPDASNGQVGVYGDKIGARHSLLNAGNIRVDGVLNPAPVQFPDTTATAGLNMWSGTGAPSATTVPNGRTVTDMVTNGTTTVTSATAAFVAADVGRPVTGTGIPANTTIASRTNSTTVVLSAAAGTGTGGTLNICIANVGDLYLRIDGGSGTYMYQCSVVGLPGTFVAVL